jgi:hypothetical protein
MVRVSQYIRQDEEGGTGFSGGYGQRRQEGCKTVAEERRAAGGIGSGDWRLEGVAGGGGRTEGAGGREGGREREMGCTIEGEWRKHLPAAR